jgi:isoleucyl-tRNA synthetase
MDYRDDIRLSEEILTRLVEGYRRIRNTCRYLLGNLYDFDPGRDAVPVADLLPIDRVILDRLERLVERVRKAYEEYEFHVLYHGLHNFCAVDLSAFYLDVLKDRLYTSAPASRLRRSAQTAMHQILVTVVKLMAPVLSFTADEVWRYVPMRDKPVSVHLTEFPAVRPELLDETLAGEWERLLQVRDEVLRALETARKDKRIGSAQEAAVELAVPDVSFEFFGAHREDLETICIVSRLAIRRAANAGADAAVAVRVERASGAKCPRCWNYRDDIGASAAHPSLCARCTGALDGRD